MSQNANKMCQNVPVDENPLLQELGAAALALENRFVISGVINLSHGKLAKPKSISAFKAAAEQIEVQRPAESVEPVALHFTSTKGDSMGH